MALTATPWTPGAHEAAAAFVSQRISLEHPSQAAHSSCGPPGSLSNSQLETFYTAFNQGPPLIGNMSPNSPLAGTSGPGPALDSAANPSRPTTSRTASAEQQQRGAVPKVTSEEDVFSAIGGLEISSKRDAEGNVAVLAANAPPHAAPAAHAQAAEAAAAPSAIPNSHSAASLGGASANSMAASPGGAGFTTGPSIGDLPQDETPSRTLFVRNLKPGTDAAELQRAFEAYGEVRTLYTAALARGFIMIVYFDLRAACLAMHSLQGMQLGATVLDIHFAAPRDGSPEQHEGHVTLYNLDPSVSLEKLYQSFVTFGDVKDIRSVTGRPNAKLIEYYDVRHATAAYQALSQGVASKRRTKSFDMAALPSVPEMNDSNIPSRTSQESMAALTGGTDSWGSNAGSAEIAALASQAAAAALQASAPSAQQPLRALSSSSGELASANIDQLGMAQLVAMQGSGALGGGADASLAGSSYASAGGVPHIGSTGALSDAELHFGPGTLPQVGSLGLHEAGRQLSAGLPQTRRLSASGSMEHLQRLGSAPLGPGGGGAAYSGGRGSLPGSMSSGGLPGGMPLGGRIGSGDGAAPGQLRGGVLSAAAARMQSLGSAGSGSLPPGLGYDASSHDGGSVGGSRSANDLAALYEAQQHLAAQQAALLQQQRTLAAMQTASLAGSSQQMYNSPSAGSMSPGSSPSAPGWAHLQQPRQQAEAQLQQQAQVQAALMQSAGLGGLSVGQLQAFLAAQDAGGGAGGLPRSASTSAVMQQQLGPQMNARLAAALQAQSIATQLPGRLGPKDARRSDDGGSFGGGSSGGGGRFARRGSESAAAERRSAQERLYSLDLDRVLAGDDARTTLMVRHIPNKYTQKMLLATIDEYFRGTYDFFYLPIDFKNKCNVGYAFINMLRPEYVVPLVERFNNRKWEKFNSEKVCSITYARIQGKNAMVAHFQNSSLLHEDKRCRPVLFRSDGPLAGEPEPFPVGPNSRLRPQRPPARDTHREHKLRERDAAW